MQPLNFHNPFYLPDTRNRLDRLRDVIHGRPVAIVVHGPSVSELGGRMGELKDSNICYASLNRFQIIERDILSPIGAQVELLLVGSMAEIPALHDDIAAFIARGNTLFLTEHAALPKIRRIGQEHPRILSCRATGPYPGKPTAGEPFHTPVINSLASLIHFCIAGMPSAIILFGADGGRGTGDELYYKQTDPVYGSHHRTKGQSLGSDTGKFNALMFDLLGRCYALFGYVPIYNCSLESHYGVIPKVSYDKAITLLRGKA